jgi:hypothetical protein
VRRTVSDLTLDKMILADVNGILSKRMARACFSVLFVFSHHQAGKLVIDGNCPALTIRYTFLSPPSVELGVSLSQAFENIIIEWNGMSRNFLSSTSGRRPSSGS